MLNDDDVSVVVENNGQWIRVFPSQLACALAKDAIDAMEMVYLRLPINNTLFFERCIRIHSAFRMCINHPTTPSSNLFLDPWISKTSCRQNTIMCVEDFIQMCKFRSVDYCNILFCIGAIVTFLARLRFDISVLRFEIVNGESITVTVRKVHMLRRTKHKYRLPKKTPHKSFVEGGIYVLKTI